LRDLDAERESMGLIRRRKALVGCGALVLLLAATVTVGLVALRSQLLGPEGHYFDSGDVRIHYTDEGAGTPVVLVHGLGMTAHAQWRRSGQIDIFKKRHRVITLDNRGHGRSDKPHDPGQYGAEMSEDLVRLLDHLQIRKAHVVGYSLGGIITLKFVATHPDRVLSAAVCAAGWGGQRPTPENLAFAEAVARGFERGEIDLVLKRLGGYPQLNFAERLGVRTALTLSGMSRSLAAVIRGLHGLDATEEQLRANTVPVLTIIGDKDGLLSDAQALHDHMANNTLVILPGANHGSAGGAASFLPELEVFMQNSTLKAPT
jgi:pimeloyl-ACP methyl ester carboxylesterase